MKTLTEHDILNAAVWELDKTPSEVKKYLQEFIETLQDQLMAGESVTLPGLGTLKIDGSDVAFIASKDRQSN